MTPSIPNPGGSRGEQRAVGCSLRCPHNLWGPQHAAWAVVQAGKERDLLFRQ